MARVFRLPLSKRLFDIIVSATLLVCSAPLILICAALIALCDRRLICPFKGEALNNPEDDVAGVIIYGGSHNVGEQEKYPFLRDELLYIEQCLARDIPVLGICLGGQLIAHSLGATVSPRTPAECEFGYYPICPTAAGRGWIPDALHVVQAHYEEFALPATAQCLASSERYDNQAYRYGDNVIGLQFHPE